MTVDSYSELMSCACSCIYKRIMIVYNQLDKLEFVEWINIL